MSEKDIMLKKLELFLEEIGDRKLKETITVTIFYSTAEKDVFNVSLIFWANVLVATKNRKKYLYYKNRLINLEHVVKMEYVGLDESML